MIDFEEARGKILKKSSVLPSRRVRVHDAIGSVLAEHVKARENIPLFNASAVDGYGVHRNDIESAVEFSPVTLQLAGTLRAGDNGKEPLKKGNCVKLMTGAMVPRGVDTVIMREFAEEVDHRVILRARMRRGDNVRRRGEEFVKGALVLKSGTLITPPVVGLLATLGRSTVKVYRKPKVALIITGNELAPADEPLRRGFIRESNSPALIAALRSVGIERIRVNRVADNRSALIRVLSTALRAADVIITVGGVSVGDFDYVREVAHTVGVEKVFWRVAIKPGKPFFFGTKAGKLVFGLPGNPVSALLTFHLLVVPALRRVMGCKPRDELFMRARLEHPLRRNPERMEFVRGLVRRTSAGELIVSATRGQDSHMLGGLAAANCLIHVQPGTKDLGKSRFVDVQLLSWQL